MKRWTTPLAILAGTAVMIACATAQAQEPVPGAQKDKEKPAAKQNAKPASDKKASPDQAKKGDEKADAADEAEPKPLLNSISLAYTTWNSGGHINEIHQNGWVPSGYGIASLSLLQPFTNGQYNALQLNGNPGDDFGFRLLSQLGTFSLLTTASQFSYFDPNLDNIYPSRNKNLSAVLDDRIAPNFGIFGSLSLEQDEHHFSAPLDQPNYQNRTVTLGTQKRMGDTTIGASFSEVSNSNAAPIQPNSLTDHAEIHGSRSFGPRFMAEGSIGFSRIQLQGLPDSWIHNYDISGVYDLTDASSIGAHFDQTSLELSSVQNAYVQKKLDSGVTYDTHLGKWGLGFAFGHREEERLRTDHSFVDVPAWNSESFKLNGRIAKDYRLGIKASVEDLSSQPVFQTNDPTLLYWERKASVQAKISGGNEVNTSYLSYNYRYRRNDERDFNLNWTNVALGGSRVFSPKLLGYVEFASDQYLMGGSNAAAGALGDYFPTSETFMFGVDYTRNARENFSFVMTSFYTQDQWGQQIAVSYHRDLGKDRTLQITYSPWLQRDRLYDVDTFTAPILQVKIGTRF